VTTHARLSPSARYRWSTCPASVNACTKYESEKAASSKAAIDGTHSHTLLEHCIKNAKVGEGAVDPKQFIGTLLQDHEGMFGVDADRVARVRVATDYIRQRVAELGPGTVVIAETRVEPEPLLCRKDLGGTVDVQIINGDFGELIDYKDGMNPVVAENNLQLEQYSFGVIAGRIDHGKLLTKMRWTIIQPKIAVKGGTPISSFDITVAELLGERLFKIAAEAEATDNPNAPFVAGEKQCTYCPHRGSCKAAVDYSLSKSGIKFENMNFAAEASSQQPNSMTNDQIAELVIAGPLLRKLIEAAEEEALLRFTSGVPVAGLKVVRGPGRREWALPDEEIAAKLRRMKVPKDLVIEQSVISPAKAEKLVWVDKAGAHLCLTERQKKVLTTDMMKRSEGRLTVVPEADKRDAVSFADAGKMFGPVEAAPAAEAPLPSWLS
jgi:hypothetical protein